LLVPILILGLFLRFSGLDHGLPDYIVHCDTPKQLALIPDFVDGNLVPPGRYPVGHMYLYAGAIRLWKSLVGDSDPVPVLSHETRKEFFPYNVTVRAIQSLLSAAIPLFIFLFCRNLWGPWTGIIAAFLVACDPIHMTYSRQEMGEVPQFFWVSVSLYFSSRILLYEKGRNGLLAGLFAGLALATKMYGGYIILAALAAISFSGPGKVKKIGWVVFGFCLGTILGSPYLWVDPSGWWQNTVTETIDEFYVRTPGGRSGQVWQGLTYLWQGLNRRFHFPWIVLGLAGIGLLVRRHQKRDLLFLFPLTTALILVGFALTYLREWDLVNLTPYLSISIAVLIVHLYDGGRNNPIIRPILKVGILLFLFFQGSVAIRDALLARFPDTRQLARQWVLEHVEPGTSLLFDTNISGAKWVPVDAGLDLIGTSLKDLWRERSSPELTKPETSGIERAWWDPPLDYSAFQKLQVFDLRNTYFENPEITFFRPNHNQNPPTLIMPHVRVRPNGPVFMDTSWSRRQPMDLLSDTPSFQYLDIFCKKPLQPFSYAVLGQGQASLFFGPSLGFPLKAEPTRLNSGSVTPYRRLFPWFPRSFHFSLSPQRDPKGLWLGLYPDPLQMIPLLARYGNWPEIEEIVRRSTIDRDFPSEALLWYGTALAAQGKHKEAEAVMVALHPGKTFFLDRYRRLASGQEPFTPFLKDMAQTTLADLSVEDVYWPIRSGDRGELDLREPKPALLSEENLFHVWMPQSFLPGFIKASLRFKQNGVLKTGGGKLRIIAVQANALVKQLNQIKLEPGQEKLVVPLHIQEGPVRLEFILETETPNHPTITSLHLSQDYQAEFAWRWGIMSKHLGKIIGQ
jgi:hypothetical protein